MRFRRAMASLLLPLAMAGCAVPLVTAPYHPSAYAPDDGRPTIVCLGDSLTAGDAAPASESYPAWLQRRLNAAGYRYRVVNAGLSGDRVAGGLDRLDRDVLHYHPAIVVVALGSNDLGHTPVSAWSSDLAVIARRIQSSGARVVLGGLHEPGLTAVYERVATESDDPLVWLTDGLWSRPGLWGDAHHPNGQGYRLVMENVWRVLKPMLHK